MSGKTPTLSRVIPVIQQRPLLSSLAHLLPVPQDGGDSEADEESDPLRKLRADIRGARGKALLVETSAAGWGEGMSAAPRRDWHPERLGPQPPDSMPELMGQGFTEVLAACGCPPGMFAQGADAGQREAYRRWCALVVTPLGRMLQAELSSKLEADIGLDFSGLYAHDLSGRARAFQSMVGGGMEAGKAAALSGLVMEG